MPFWEKVVELTGHDDDPKAAAAEQSSHRKDLPPPVPAAEHKATTSSKQGDWHDKSRDLLDGGATTRREAEAERLRLERERIEKEEAALMAEQEARSFRAKLKHLFKSGEEEAERRRLEAEAEQKRLAAERARAKEHSWTAKIKDVFDDDDEERERERQRLAEEAMRNQRFGARVRGIFNPHHTPAVEEKQTKTQKFFEILEGKDKEPPKDKRNWLHEHINTTLGGGKKAEKEEDLLDKTIDLFQEHVLREGDQSDESAAAQAKDRMIANSIRKLTGHDKDKDK